MDTFRGRKVLRVDARGRKLLSHGEEGLEVWVVETPESVIFVRTGPFELLTLQYVTLVQEARTLGLPEPRLADDGVYVPDWGESFYARRLRDGWADTMHDIIVYLANLVRLYPNACVLDVALRNLVVNEAGIASHPDMRTALTPAEAKSWFNTFDDWVIYAKRQIQISWTEFLEEHGDEIDLVQERLEEQGKAAPTPTPSETIEWPA